MKTSPHNRNNWRAFFKLGYKCLILLPQLPYLIYLNVRLFFADRRISQLLAEQRVLASEQRVLSLQLRNALILQGKVPFQDSGTAALVNPAVKPLEEVQVHAADSKTATEGNQL